MLNRSARRRLASGFTLIEVLVTLVVLMFGLLGTAGLMVRGQRASYEAYQRQQALAIASTCTPSFISRLVGYSGLESKIVVLPGSSSRGQLFQGNIAQNYIGALQVLFLPDGRIVLFSSGGAAGMAPPPQQIGQRNVARVRSYWYVDPN